MSLGENSLVAAYQGKGQLKSRPSGTRVVTFDSLHSEIKCLINHGPQYQYLYTCDELKFQNGCKYGRQNNDRSMSQLIGQLQRQKRVNFDIFEVKVLITRSENSVRISQFKMEANMAAKTHKALYLRS